MPFVPIFDGGECRILTEAGEVLVTEANEELLLEYCANAVTGVQANGAVGDVEVNAEASVRRSRRRRKAETVHLRGVFAKTQLGTIEARGAALTLVKGASVKGIAAQVDAQAGATVKSLPLKLATSGAGAIGARGGAKTRALGLSVSRNLDDYEALLVLLLDSDSAA